MESSRKRKASLANSPSAVDGSASKRLRLLNSNAAPRGRNPVQEVGHRIVDQLKVQTDKSGRLIATEFIELPDEDEIPEYYEFIKLPLALETIEAKLKRNEYPTVTTLESDLRRLVQNAKDFNDPDSQIYEDAERIRKLVFNFMKQNNPAYKEDPNYSGFPTPIPKVIPVLKTNGTKKEESIASEAASRQVSEKPKRAGTEQSDRKSSLAPSASATGGDQGDEDEDDGEGGVDLDFTGKTFQEAQQMILRYMLEYIDEEGLEIYSPFGNLPTRKLEDYYKVIRHPVSLKSVLKRTKGIHGRAPPTNITDFKNWDAYEDEVSFIWRNAKEYNEDESDMYKLAEDFEKHFRDLLAEAKEKVEEPSGPRIKIGAPKPKVTLNLSQPARGSPALGVAVDNEALARQRLLVQAGANGQASQPIINGFPRTSSSDGIRPPSSNRSGSPFGTAIKAEHGSTHSPAPMQQLSTMQQQLPHTNGIMLPPNMRPMSGSPYPGGAPPPVTSYHYTAPAFLPPTPLRSYPQDLALLPAVTITSHPNLKVTTPFHLSITPHATLAQQSSTVTLPNSHYFVQISATISKQLSMGRPYKLFVSVNGTRLTQRDTQFQSDTSRRTHVYEGSLAQGVNRVEVEVAAAQVEDEKGLDVEKVTVFANLMR